nr:nuclear poly(A) polymerase 4-like [Tanacetum cinerariifolium]
MEDHELDLLKALRVSMQLAIDATSFFRSTKLISVFFYFNVDIFILDVASLKEAKAVVKKKYCLANPILFAGPTEADIYRNALLEKLLMESRVYESAEEITKREEILLRDEQTVQVGAICHVHSLRYKSAPYVECIAYSPATVGYIDSINIVHRRAGPPLEYVNLGKLQNLPNFKDMGHDVSDTLHSSAMTIASTNGASCPNTSTST